VSLFASPRHLVCKPPQLEKAEWFADRFAGILPNPAVYQVTVEEQYVWAYTNEREEQEFLVRLPSDIRPKRIR
jgi:hypothetical protein